MPKKKPTKKPIKKPVKKKKKQVKKSYGLYHKGKKLTKYYTNFVKQVAENKKQDVSTPKKLHKFYTDNEDRISKMFDRGLTSFKRGTPATLNDLEKADAKGKLFILDVDGKRTQISKEKLAYEIVMTERWLNDLLDTTGFAISYTILFDGTIVVNLPKRMSSPEWLDESAEDIADTLLILYGIVIYFSDPPSKASKEEKSRIKNKKRTYRETIDTSHAQTYKEIKKGKRRKK